MVMESHKWKYDFAQVYMVLFCFCLYWSCSCIGFVSGQINQNSSSLSLTLHAVTSLHSSSLSSYASLSSGDLDSLLVSKTSTHSPSLISYPSSSPSLSQIAELETSTPWYWPDRIMGILIPLWDHSAWILGTTFVAYQVGLVVYRLWFSPLAKFPGPKLAAASLWLVYFCLCLQERVMSNWQRPMED